MSKFKFLPLGLLALFITMTSCTTESIEQEDAIYAQVDTSSELEKEVIELVNEYRTSQGLNTLEYGKVAYGYAADHNDYMIEAGKISHDNFDLRASNLAVEAKADFVSENLAKDFKTANGVVKAWINSPTHKKVMEGDFKYTAINIKADANGKLYFTQLYFK